MEYTGGDDNDIETGVKTPLEGNGDFRSQECLDLLDEADIVVTNEPFSLAKDFISTLIEHNKKFLIIINKNAITYKEVFPLIKENKAWLGCTSPSNFNTPNGMTKKMNGLTRWLTNLDIKKRHEKMTFWKLYTPEEFPRYDNYPDAINVDKVNEIPEDYDGLIGVPITFLDKYNPDQFEIIGSFNANHETNPLYYYVPSSFVSIITNGKETLWNGPVVNKKPLYKRIVIRKRGVTQNENH